jgi:acyl-CoA thioesterase I
MLGGPERPMFTLYTFGDSILDCGRYNDFDINPGQLIVRNDDTLYPEFSGKDLSRLGHVRLEHRAVDGATVEDLPYQAAELPVVEQGESLALITIGGNDLLTGLLLDHGPGVDAFAAALDTFICDLPVDQVLLGNVYDPTLGDDALDFTGLGPAVVRRNHRRVNAAIAEIAARHGTLVDLHAHFMTGDLSWFTSVIEPSLVGASEVRRCFLQHFPDAWCPR